MGYSIVLFNTGHAICFVEGPRNRAKNIDNLSLYSRQTQRQYTNCLYSSSACMVSSAGSAASSGARRHSKPTAPPYDSRSQTVNQVLYLSREGASSPPTPQSIVFHPPCGTYFFRYLDRHRFSRVQRYFLRQFGVSYWLSPVFERHVGWTAHEKRGRAGGRGKPLMLLYRNKKTHLDPCTWRHVRRLRLQEKPASRSRHPEYIWYSCLFRMVFIPRRSMATYFVIMNVPLYRRRRPGGDRQKLKLVISSPLEGTLWGEQRLRLHRGRGLPTLTLYQYLRPLSLRNCFHRVDSFNPLGGGDLLDASVLGSSWVVTPVIALYQYRPPFPSIFSFQAPAWACVGGVPGRRMFRPGEAVCWSTVELMVSGSKACFYALAAAMLLVSSFPFRVAVLADIPAVYSLFNAGRYGSVVGGGQQPPLPVGVLRRMHVGREGWPYLSARFIPQVMSICHHTTQPNTVTHLLPQHLRSNTGSRVEGRGDGDVRAGAFHQSQIRVCRWTHQFMRRIVAPVINRTDRECTRTEYFCWSRGSGRVQG